jgi:hypothetical protein
MNQIRVVPTRIEAPDIWHLLANVPEEYLDEPLITYFHDVLKQHGLDHLGWGDIREYVWQFTDDLLCNAQERLGAFADHMVECEKEWVGDGTQAPG